MTLAYVLLLALTVGGLAAGLLGAPGGGSWRAWYTSRRRARRAAAITREELARLRERVELEPVPPALLRDLGLEEEL